MKLRSIIGAIGLSLFLSGCPKTYSEREREAEDIMTHHADYCIARECSREERDRLCRMLKPYGMYFKKYENDKVYGERARKIREAIVNTLSRCD